MRNPNLHIIWENKRLKEAGIDKRKLRGLINTLEILKEKLEDMGLALFVDGSGCINVWSRNYPIHEDVNGTQDNVIADILMDADGGAW